MATGESGGPTIRDDERFSEVHEVGYWDVSFSEVVAANGDESADIAVLGHGRAFDRTIWERTGTLEALSDAELHVFAYDTPGFGTTPARDESIGFPEEVNAGFANEFIHDTVTAAVHQYISLRTLVVPSMNGLLARSALENTWHDNPADAFVFIGAVGLSGVQVRSSIARDAHVLVLRGSEDPLVSEFDGRELAGKFQHSHYQEIPGGHAFYADPATGEPTDQAEALNEALIDFIRV